MDRRVHHPGTHRHRTITNKNLTQTRMSIRLNKVINKLMKKENIPNILTIIRFILIPFIYVSVLSKHFLIYF